MVIQMKAGKRARTIIKYYESLGDGDKTTNVLEPYLDHIGVATLGYGHVLYDKDPATGKLRMIRSSTHGGRRGALLAAAKAVEARWGRPHLLDEAEADALLEEDLNKWARQMSPYITRHPTKQCEFDAMVALAFNIGVGNFASSTMLRRHNAGNMTFSDASMKTLADRSKAKAPIANGVEAFTRWSNSGKPPKWTLGLFRRRYAEALVYFTHEPSQALLRANSFNG